MKGYYITNEEFFILKDKLNTLKKEERKLRRKIYYDNSANSIDVRCHTWDCGMIQAIEFVFNTIGIK